VLADPDDGRKRAPGNLLGRFSKLKICGKIQTIYVRRADRRTVIVHVNAVAVVEHHVGRDRPLPSTLQSGNRYISPPAAALRLSKKQKQKMRFPAAMITTAVAACFAIPGLAVTADGPARQPTTQTQAEAASTASETVVGPNNETAVTAARSIQHYMTNAICLYSPNFCDKHQLRKSRNRILFENNPPPQIDFRKSIRL